MYWGGDGGGGGGAGEGGRRKVVGDKPSTTPESKLTKNFCTRRGEGGEQGEEGRGGNGRESATTTESKIP